MEENKHICQFCNKEYKSISNLHHHQKTAKFCLELQQKDNKNKLKNIEIFKCEYCNKEFTVKYNYSVHVISCKEKKIQDSNNLNTRLKELELENEKLKKEKDNEIEKLKKENIELKLNLKFEKNNIAKLEKDIIRLTKLTERPISTTNNVYQDNSTKTNYTLQFTQYLKDINIMDKNTINHTMNNIPQEIIDNYNFLDIKNEVSNTLSDNMIQFMFCTDASRKIVVIKKEDNSAERMDLDEFLLKYFELGQKGINDYLDTIKTAVDEKVNDDIMTDQDFYKFKTPFVGIKQAISSVDKHMLSSDNLFKLTSKNVIKKSKKLCKNNETVSNTLTNTK